jgi:hypothetical protein
VTRKPLSFWIRGSRKSLSEGDFEPSKALGDPLQVRAWGDRVADDAGQSVAG